ncbi:hypothetical protein Y032_0057g2803 [Ancylostoma ceylanicum]|nr:hypothetical protein Y032_0057g2803 [Ancylostoma ceylanicum]
MLPRTPLSNSSFYVSFDNREDLLRQIQVQQQLSEAFSLLSERRPTEHYVLEQPTAVASPGPSTSTQPQQPQRPPQRRRSLYALTGERFLGTVEPSIKGKHPVIRYSIPGSPLCYSFQHLRTNSTYKVYRCTGCRKSNTNTMIAVIGDQFIGDPCMLAHNCIPTKSAKDKVERIVIKECRRIKEDKKYAGLSSRVAWQDVEDFIEECGSEDPEEKDAMLHHFHRYGFAARQRTFRR